ncbi:hypothetical protein SYJ56_07930 [Algoriphagus sp. D3-2-R+10]|uniref:hypothetical protein n=1 Tax=Algoriphagus aurantiacus TaxID=3103948 RepID=UPI002B389B7D|nr:hypothetical protein [Algoriphagus sp. D3-2-R+10]MEB2775233.1 hypothetical protein [Algoriphagus sp. D3-2-R+10]
MNKKINLGSRKFEFKKSSYSYKNFEDRNKRPFNPTLASDILEYLYSCIVAGYFYIRQDCPIDIVDFYDLIDEMESENPELLYISNKELFKEILGIKDINDSSNKIEEEPADGSKKK